MTSFLMYTCAVVLSVAAEGSATDAMTDIDSIQPVKDAFNEDIGKTRLLLLLSPT